MTEELSDEEKLSEIYVVLSDLRYLIHKESNDLGDFQKIAQDYYKRIARCAFYAGEMLGEEVISKFDEP